MKVLFIEDNDTIARQVGEFLANHRWNVDFAHNARLGIELALAHFYDVILLDLNLPDLDGLAVCLISAIGGSYWWSVATRFFGMRCCRNLK